LTRPLFAKPGTLARDVLADVVKAAEAAMNALEKQLPRDFPEEIHVSVKEALTSRLNKI
jgi:hypothetical protein